MMRWKDYEEIRHDLCLAIEEQDNFKNSSATLRMILKKLEAQQTRKPKGQQ